MAHILYIEDDDAIAKSILGVLRSEGYAVTHESRGDQGLTRAQKETFDLVLTDLKLPGMNGLELVKHLHAFDPRLPVILVTAHGTAETAIEAIKLGAFDYLLKPFEMPELLELLSRALLNSRLMTAPVEIGNSETQRDSIVGNSRSMQAIYKEIGRVAAKPVNVLIRGETGTGKELIARALYQHSTRAQRPFVAINCAAIPENLLESELFGHERGAFTGAETRRIGRFEQADQGTIFLDEIGDMTLSTQVKLLRVLQEKTLQRVGGKELIPVDVRIIAATHRHLESMIAEKQFREDLYYRLSVVALYLPPLRERREDIPQLVKYFLGKYGRELGVERPSIQESAMDLLQAQNWPGNIRELENVVKKALLSCHGYSINLDHIQAALDRPASLKLPGTLTLREIAKELLTAAERGEIQDAYSQFTKIVEKELFTEAIQMANGNQSQAARLLGTTRLTMREKLNQFGIHPRQEAAETNL